MSKFVLNKSRRGAYNLERMSTSEPPPEPAREDPSRLTKEELSRSGAETISAIGALARLAARNSVSTPLQSTIGTFADYEKTLGSTEDMLKKTMKGMNDMNDALDEISASLKEAAPPPR